jgi:hypothetical protein
VLQLNFTAVYANKTQTIVQKPFYTRSNSLVSYDAFLWCRMELTADDKYWIMSKKAIVAYFKVLDQYLPEGAEEN